MKHPLRRRDCLRLGLGMSSAGLACALPLRSALAQDSTQALPERTLVFPRDHGSHPDFQTEWWYVTGFLDAVNADSDSAPAHPRLPAYGFQITFFRSRIASTQSLSSAFAAKQLIFAHAAITDARDLQHGRLVHDQRMAREGMGLAFAKENNMDTAIGPWRTASTAGKPGQHHAHIDGDVLGLDLTLEDTQPVLLQGKRGLSRKGPQPQQASYYYSRPQLRVQGTLRIGSTAAAQTVQGKAWLDHEWSLALMAREAEGWDWIGMNLDDGSALTAFRLRQPDGTALWAGGSWRSADGKVRAFSAQEVRWFPGRLWSSPRTGTRYPVEWQVQTPAGTFGVRAVVDDQELDASASTGGVYWEGLSELTTTSGQRLGLGYLEMTGYREALRLG